MRAVDEDGPTLAVDLLTDAAAADADASDALSVQNADPSVTTTNGLTLNEGTHYTVVGSAFNMTAAGFALFNDLAVGEDDTFTLNYDISDGTAVISNTLDVTIDGANDDPTAFTIVRSVDEDGPTLTVDLLTDASASDPDTDDVLTVQNVASTVTTTNGIALTLGTHYTVAGATFNLTAAGFALFNDLAAGEDDTFTLSYDIDDGTTTIGNTLDVTVDGANDDPTASPIVRSVDEDGPTLSVSLLGDANASDPDATDELAIQNIDGSINTTNGITLTEGVHYTVASATFDMTAAGFALFNDLADSETDTFTFNYEIFDGTSAISNTLDVTINGANDGAFLDAPQVASFPFGNGAVFGGERLDFTFTESLGGVPAGDLTTSFWFNDPSLDTGGADPAEIYFSYAISAEFDSEFVVGNRGGELTVVFDDDVFATGVAIPDDGDWHHFAMTFNAATGDFEVFVDGNSEFSGTTTPGALTPNGALVFGQEQNTPIGGFDLNRSFRGGLGDFGLFSGVLGAGIIANIAAGIVTPADADVFFRWNDATQSFEDISGGANVMNTRGDVVTAPGSAPLVHEDGAIELSGITVNDVDLGSVLDIELSVANGALEITGSTAGLTFVDADGSDGTLEFFGTAADINAAFANSIRYTPDTDFDGIDTLDVTLDGLGSDRQSQYRHHRHSVERCANYGF